VQRSFPRLDEPLELRRGRVRHRCRRRAIFDLVDEVRKQLDAGTARPDGYNVGINVGEAAGQTVMHLHVHVIPRYRGDVADPRGGVRHVIPGKGNYLAGK
jgi:diadenosine tetraphosphate (Ap4A) HIT family hydrolase